MGGIAAGLLGCASSWEGAPVEAPDAEERVIVRLQTRDSELTLTSTASGVRYTVLDADGVLHSSLTLEQLREVAPQLYELARQATASSTSGDDPEDAGRPVLDASLFGEPSTSRSGGRR